MALVLCTGVHTTLVHTRKLMLEKADHSVVTALDHASLIAACKQHNFEVAVICQSCSPELKREWVGVLRKHRPSVKVLEIYSHDSGKALKEADTWLEAPASPTRLVGALTKLTREKKPSTKRRAMLLEEVRVLCARVMEAQSLELDAVLDDLTQALDILAAEDAMEKVAGQR